MKNNTQEQKKKRQKKSKHRFVKVKRKDTDTILYNAKCELKRLGSTYSEVQINDLIVADDQNKNFSGINWETVIKNCNPSKWKPPVKQESVVVKEKPRLIFNTAKQRSFKITKKEDKSKADSVKLVTIEFGNNTEYTQKEKALSDQLDDLLKEEHIGQPYEIPNSLDTHAEGLVQERRKLNLESRMSSSGLLPLEIDMVKARRLIKSSNKHPESLMIQNNNQDLWPNTKTFK